MEDRVQDTPDTVSAAKARARVETVLMARLRAAGYRKPRGLAQADFDVGLAALADRLAYLTPDNLATLAEAIVDTAALPNWPAERWVLDMAATLQRPPVQHVRVIQSWLGSVEGPKAVARGDLVPLYRFLQRHKRPPVAYEMRKIAEAASADNHRLMIWHERLAIGTLIEADRQALAHHDADLADALAIVDAGNAARAAKGAAA